MRIHYLQHVPFEGLGYLESWARSGGHELSCTRLFQNDPLPSVDQIDWLIVMGGPMGACDDHIFDWLAAEKQFIEKAIEGGKVVLGVCLGAQLIAAVLGARVYPNAHKEIGWFPIEQTAAARNSSLFADWPDRFDVFHWHGDTFDVPDSAVHIARSEACENQAFAYEGRVVGLQFHLELNRENVEALIRNCSADLVQGEFIQTPTRILEPKEDFQQSNSRMSEFLDRLEALSG